MTGVRKSPDGTSRSGKCTIFGAARLGSLEDFSFIEIEAPVPGPGEVRIRVEAAALGYVDTLIALGKYQIQPQLPHVPGGEIAGVVDALGEDVTTAKVGDRVFTWQLGGGIGEFAIVPAADLHKSPTGLSDEVAAAMVIDYPTAHYALFDRGHLVHGETVLVLAAASGVGAAAVQLAKQAGAFVVGAASTQHKRAHVAALGADAVIDYTDNNWRDVLRKSVPRGTIDVVFDPVGGNTFEAAFRSLGKEGRHLVVGFAGGEIPRLPANLPLLKSASLIGVDLRHQVATRPQDLQKSRNQLFKMVRTNEIMVPIATVLPFSSAPDALTMILDRTRVGKIVVKPRPAR